MKTNHECKCRIDGLEPDQIRAGFELTIDYCPIHAAAHELLEACKEMLQAVCDFNEGRDHEVNSWISYWSKAIAKAEG